MDKRPWRNNIRWLILAYCGYAREAWAERWELAGDLGQQLQYNDNMAFSANNRQAEFGYLLNPVLRAALKTKAFDLGFTGQGDIRRYTDSRWDCDAYNLELSGRYAISRNTFRLAGGYAQGCSYLQQLTDTGILIPKVQFDNIRVAPTWTWRWTRRTALIAETAYSKIQYDQSNTQATTTTVNSVSDANTLGIGLVGNETYSVRVSADHKLSRRLSLNGGTYFSYIKYSEPTLPGQRIYGFQAGLNYAIDRRWAFSVGGGPRWVDFDPSTTDPDQKSTTALGDVANISLNFHHRQNDVSMGYSNSINSSAIGQTQEYHNIFLSYSRKIDKRLNLSAAVSFQHSDALNGQQSGSLENNFKRDYVNVAAGVAWKFAKDWQVRADYSYRWQDYHQSDIGTADANMVMVSVNYSWDGVRDSR